MLAFPASLDAADFLHHYWQKQALFMPAAITRRLPQLTRNELAWLATLDDVESRIVFTEKTPDGNRYSVEHGPFANNDLERLPKRDWTLLVHDVEKHLPAMRPMLQLAAFVPEWRIDDLMVSFAAPGGSVGPHKDNYDVFLCQGTGLRDWRVTSDAVAADASASHELALLQEFKGQTYTAAKGDVLYLPPGVAHWGIAQRACMTYSIGMRAPQLSDLATTQLDSPHEDPFYRDPDLQMEEAIDAYISPQAVARARDLLAQSIAGPLPVGTALGRCVTAVKDWLQPEHVPIAEASQWLDQHQTGLDLEVHGMARLAWDDENAYVNGDHHALAKRSRGWFAAICRTRRCTFMPTLPPEQLSLLRWMVAAGAFEIPETP